MPNIKKISHPYNLTGRTFYCIIRQDATGYLLNDADGAFANAPADPYVSLTEHTTIKGLYELSESRSVWANGQYTITIYRQSGANPAPSADTITGAGVMSILGDTETTTAVYATTDAKDIVTRAKTLYNDLTGVRITDSNWLLWVNDGQLEIAMYKPDASTKRVPMTTILGTAQTIPYDGIQLIDVVRNMGNGSTPGQTIRKIERLTLDSLFPNWHADTPATPKYYAYEEIDPRTFWLYPASTITSIEILYGAIPGTLADLNTGTKLTIRDHYKNILLDYLLYRAYLQDTSAASIAKANGYQQAFYNALGVRAQTEEVTKGPSGA